MYPLVIADPEARDRLTVINVREPQPLIERSSSLVLTTGGNSGSKSDRQDLPHELCTDPPAMTLRVYDQPVNDDLAMVGAKTERASYRPIVVTIEDPEKLRSSELSFRLAKNRNTIVSDELGLNEIGDPLKTHESSDVRVCQRQSGLFHDTNPCEH